MREACAESLCARGAWSFVGLKPDLHKHDNTLLSYRNGWADGADSTGNAWFWSASPVANNGNNAWNVNFNNGNDNNNNKNNGGSVRLVRSGE